MVRKNRNAKGVVDLSTKRLVGLDVARAFAVLGMVIVNFKIVLGQEGPAFLKMCMKFFEGKAAATFVVLAGIGLAFMTRRSLAEQDQSAMSLQRVRIAKRALFLFVVGLSFVWIWPADILHFYSLYMLLSMLLLFRSSRVLLAASALCIFSFPALLLFLNYESGWDFSTLTYHGFWTPKGFLMHLFFNGFHPVFPWTAYMLFGLWLGRQALDDDRFLKKAMVFSGLAFVLVHVLSMSLVWGLSGGEPKQMKLLNELLGTGAMPPMPLYMLNGLSIATFVVTACVYISKQLGENALIAAFAKTGRLALSFYMAHILLGMGLIEILFGPKLGGFSLVFSTMYSLFFCAVCVLFANVWLRHYEVGPVEWLMRKLTQ
ncbi:MAG: hypothetical protein CL920_03335 [Deltaproteobacteria bacterium]|nr:hypothetical protein [Deltaproteobacteria bacterium]MBU47708.1 hypothetical protein [Deltaproteobacteria bacterium]